MRDAKVWFVPDAIRLDPVVLQSCLPIAQHTAQDCFGHIRMAANTVRMIQPNFPPTNGASANSNSYNVQNSADQGVALQCHMCGKYRWMSLNYVLEIEQKMKIENTQIQLQNEQKQKQTQMEQFQMTWTCAQAGIMCEQPEQIVNAQVIAIDNMRRTGPWHFNRLGVYPITEHLYDAWFAHPLWTMWETLVLLDQACKIGFDFQKIAAHHLLRCRHTENDCQNRLVHVLQLAALYGHTFLAHYQAARQRAQQVSVPAVNIAEKYTRPQAGFVERQIPHKFIPPKSRRKQRRDSDSESEMSGDSTSSDEKHRQLLRVNEVARMSSRNRSKTVKYTFSDEDDDDDDDDDSEVSDEEDVDDPFPFKIERILAARTKRVAVVDGQRTEMHELVEDTALGPSYRHRMDHSPSKHRSPVFPNDDAKNQHKSLAALNSSTAPEKTALNGTANVENASADSVSINIEQTTDNAQADTKQADLHVPISNSTSQKNAENNLILAPKTQQLSPAIEDVEEYLVKEENTSYLHVKWYTETQLHERFGSVNALQRLRHFRNQRATLEAKNADELGGAHFDPRWIEVDRIISQRINEETKEEEYLVKWNGLSYSLCTWETAKDIKDDAKIATFHRFQRYSGRMQPTWTKEEAAQRWRNWYTDSPSFLKGSNTLRDYQVHGLNWLIAQWHSGRNGILADEMGLGKTIQVIAFLEHLRLVDRNVGPFLIIVPLSTLSNWKREFESWTDMNALIYYDPQRGRESRAIIREHEFFYPNTRTAKFHALVTSYEIFMVDLAELQVFEWQICVIDEGHRLKNKANKLLDSLRQLNCSRRLLMTGTPIQNSTNELWSLLNFLQPDVFYSEHAFQQNFGQLQESVQVQRLQEAIKPYILRRLKETVEKSLPPKEETIIDIELTTTQKKYYRAIYERNLQWLRLGTSQRNMPKLINIEMELRKCCNHPWLLSFAEEREVPASCSQEEYMNLTVQASGKLVLLDKLLPKLEREKHRVLIFSQLKMVLDILQDYCTFKGYGFERLDGGVSGNDREAAIERFNNKNSDRFVFLLSTRAGGVGLNLASADTVILFDSDWNPQQDLQAQARAHRIGQTNKVMIYRLVTRNTYESQMFVRASKKLGIDQAVLTNLTHGAKAVSDADRENIDKLLRLGAYGALNDDESAATKFKEANIDEILENYAHVVKTNVGETEELEGDGSKFTPAPLKFSKMTFESANADSAIDLMAPDFWHRFTDTEAEERNPISLLTMLADPSTIDNYEKFFDRVTKAAEYSLKLKADGQTDADRDNLIDLLVQINSLKQFSKAQRDTAQQWLDDLQKKSRRTTRTLQRKIASNHSNARGRPSRGQPSSPQPENDDPEVSDLDDTSSSASVESSSEDSDHVKELPSKFKQVRRYRQSSKVNHRPSKRNTYICGYCFESGRLLPCDGPCLRWFHLECVGISEPDAEEDWFCDDCAAKVAECRMCHEVSPMETEESHSKDNSGVWKCSLSSCGCWYHFDCIKAYPRFSFLGVGSAIKFRCTQHICTNCTDPGPSSTLLQCIRCPAAYHLGCCVGTEIRITKHSLLCTNCIIIEKGSELLQAIRNSASKFTQLPNVRDRRKRSSKAGTRNSVTKRKPPAESLLPEIRLKFRVDGEPILSTTARLSSSRVMPSSNGTEAVKETTVYSQDNSAEHSSDAVFTDKQAAQAAYSTGEQTACS